METVLGGLEVHQWDAAAVVEGLCAVIVILGSL